MAGWTYLLHADDPRRDDIIRILRPLAEHRGMTDPAAPLLYGGEADWQRWLEDNYTSRGERRPHYILAVGGPRQIPFHLQSFLDVAGMVGRVEFEDLADLEAYVRKVVRLEQHDSPVASPTAVFFAPDSGQDADGNRDPTYYSRRYMAAPLARRAAAWGFATRMIEGEEASRDHLMEALGTGRPALVYTASHGIAAIGQDLDTQQRMNGAICCQRTGNETGHEWLFTGDDVPDDPDDPFLEGAVFFQFACFGYGTPAQSDFSHWDVGYPETTAPEDFVAALPRSLLAHPRGPIAYIGHVDTAWLHGFDDPDDPGMPELLPAAGTTDWPRSSRLWRFCSGLGSLQGWPWRTLTSATTC